MNYAIFNFSTWFYQFSNFCPNIYLFLNNLKGCMHNDIYLFHMQSLMTKWILYKTDFDLVVYCMAEYVKKNSANLFHLIEYILTCLSGFEFLYSTSQFFVCIFNWLNCFHFRIFHVHWRVRNWKPLLEIIWRLMAIFNIT